MDRQSFEAVSAQLRMARRDIKAAVLQLRVVLHLVARVLSRPSRHTARLQEVHELPRVKTPAESGQTAVQLFLVLGTQQVRREAWVRDELLRAQYVAQGA